MTQKELKGIFLYDKKTGEFTRIKGRKKVGTWSHGYLTISINYIRYQAHRLAWLYEYGYLPANEIDHIDHNTKNNALDNLREVTTSENSKAKRLYKCNTSGHHGVIWNENCQNWRARIGVNGKTVNLGSFTDIADAITARKEAEIKYCYHKLHGSSKTSN